jgi:hypothetical protein
MPSTHLLKNSLYSLIVILSLIQCAYSQNSTAELLISKVDSTTPPNGESVTPVYFDLKFDRVVDIKES